MNCLKADREIRITIPTKGKYEVANKICSVTGQEQETIWGYVTPHKDYKFYAVKTEIGAVPGGFDAKVAWKNFHVSPKGADLLERGAKFMEEHLKFRFCGYNYFLIPERILNRGNSEEYLEDLQDFKAFKSSGEDEVNRSLENDLLELLKDDNNSANYTLFFYEINNAEFMEEMAKEQEAERDQEAQQREEERTLERQQTVVERQGQPRDDLEQFKGVYGNPDEPESPRQLWVNISCDGYLVTGAMWGDAAPWWMRSESETVFTMEDSFNNVRLEFTPGGDDLEMIHNLDFMENPLKRVGPLPEDWNSCMERYR